MNFIMLIFQRLLSVVDHIILRLVKRDHLLMRWRFCLLPWSVNFLNWLILILTNGRFCVMSIVIALNFILNKAHWTSSHKRRDVLITVLGILQQRSQLIPHLEILCRSLLLPLDIKSGLITSNLLAYHTLTLLYLWVLHIFVSFGKSVHFGALTHRDHRVPISARWKSINIAVMPVNIWPLSTIALLHLIGFIVFKYL